MAGRASSQRTRKENANFIHQSMLLEGCKPLQDILDISEIPFGGLRNVVVFFFILISIRMVNELFLLLLRNFGITYLRILNLQTQLMILNANLKHFFLCELMNRDVFICYLIFYLLCTFIYFVVSV